MSCDARELAAPDFAFGFPLASRVNHIESKSGQTANSTHRHTQTGRPETTNKHEQHQINKWMDSSLNRQTHGLAMLAFVVAFAFGLLLARIGLQLKSDDGMATSCRSLAGSAGLIEEASSILIWLPRSHRMCTNRTIGRQTKRVRLREQEAHTHESVVGVRVVAQSASAAAAAAAAAAATFAAAAD